MKFTILRSDKSLFCKGGFSNVAYSEEKMLVTARNSSCGKVMFSQVCIPSVHREGVFGSEGVYTPWTPPSGHNGQHAGGTHPTGILSCLEKGNANLFLVALVITGF